MAQRHTLLGYYMAGFRKQSYYTNKYGEELGLLKYQEVLKTRESRIHRRNTNDEGQKIQCLLCKKFFKRITRTHLANSCVEKITTHEYLEKFPNAEIIAADLKKLYSNTKESIKTKYGDELGLKKWENYCKIQAETNSYEYKEKKFNISKNEFDEYNKSRSSTVENFIRRHGEQLGIQKWEEYVERQRYTTSIKYFIEKYGVIDGTLKYDMFCHNRLSAKKIQSKIELNVFEELSKLLNDLFLSVKLDHIYYGPFDYGNLDKKKLIEFYGTYWHADPRFFNKNDIISQKKQTAQQIQSRDQAKRTYAINLGYSVFVIWEHDWYKNKQNLLTNIVKWWNNEK
jgi:hypothetical protein